MKRSTQHKLLLAAALVTFAVGIGGMLAIKAVAGVHTAVYFGFGTLIFELVLLVVVLLLMAFETVANEQVGD